MYYTLITNNLINMNKVGKDVLTPSVDPTPTPSVDPTDIDKARKLVELAEKTQKAKDFYNKVEQVTV